MCSCYYSTCVGWVLDLRMSGVKMTHYLVLIMLSMVISLVLLNSMHYYLDFDCCLIELVVIEIVVVVGAEIVNHLLCTVIFIHYEGLYSFASAFLYNNTIAVAYLLLLWGVFDGIHLVSIQLQSSQSLSQALICTCLQYHFKLHHIIAYNALEYITKCYII